MPVKALTPDQAPAFKFEHCVPDEVMEAANELLASRLDASGYAKFTLAELVSAIQRRLPGTTQKAMNSYGWLDIELFYRAAGWKVEFDSPGYNEGYAANFTFSRAR